MPGRPFNATATAEKKEEYSISDLNHEFVLHLVASAGFSVLLWPLIGREKPAGHGLAGSIATAMMMLGAVAVTAPGLWSPVIARYPGDSHHTLPGLTGLYIFLLATALAVAGVIAARSLTRWLWYSMDGRLFRVLAPASVILVFALASLLVPQVFYTAYLVIFDNLPLQWVIEPGQTVQRLGAVLLWHPGQSLSQDGAAVTLHAMLLTALAETFRLYRVTVWPFLGALCVSRLLLNLPAMIAF